MSKTINNLNKSLAENITPSAIGAATSSDLNTVKNNLGTVSKLQTKDKTVVGAINELFQNVDSGKQLIADAIDDESITKDSTFEAMSEAINNLTNKLMSSASNKVYLYKDGEENAQYGNIVEGYTGRYCSYVRNKGSDHLYMKCYGANDGPGVAYETGIAIDLTDYSLIGIEWEGVSGKYGHYSLLTTKKPAYNYGEGRSLYAGDVNSDSYYDYTDCRFEKRTQFLDITTLTGSYYITVGAHLSYSTSSYYGELKVYKIWLLK